jgi:hypothetical protein
MNTNVKPSGIRPAVAVVTPNKNRLTLLLKTMASVKAQTFADWEHTVSDDLALVGRCKSQVVLPRQRT